jgi:hypothetical protein
VQTDQKGTKKNQKLLPTFFLCWCRRRICRNGIARFAVLKTGCQIFLVTPKWIKQQMVTTCTKLP